MRAHAVWIFAVLCVGPLALGPNCVVWAQETSAAPQERDEYDQIVDDFIQYDVGKLRGEAGRIANARFQALKDPRAIPALVRGANKASRVPASCPIIVISSKLGGLMRATNDPRLLQHALDYLHPKGPETTYGTYLDNLRQIANEQMEELIGQDPQTSSTLRGGGTASQLRRSRLRLEDWSYDDLVKAVGDVEGTQLLQVLGELKDRKGSIYTQGLAEAIETVADDVKPIARGLLATRLARMTDRTLRAKLKAPDAEVRAAAAMSEGSPIRSRGCRLAAASLCRSLRRSRAANGVSVSEGAIAFTLILGASSAARERVKPSTAPLAAAIEACIGMPVATATVENSTTDG